MNKSIKRTFVIFIMLFLIITATVYAGKLQVGEMEIVFADGSKTQVLVSKNKTPEQILKENNIVLLQNETIRFNSSENIVYIDNNDNTDAVKTEEVKSIVTNLTENNISNNLEDTKEEIIKEQIEIPFNTITKEVPEGEQDGDRSMVIQIGENGIKEITYRVLSSNNMIITKKKLSEQIIKEPKDKIIQLVPKVTSRSLNRGSSSYNIDYSINANMSAREAFNRICSEKGLRSAERNAWAQLIQKESGWRVNARNPSSGAYGLPQALPGNKMSSAGSDWRTNPYTQLNWMYTYMKNRYGSCVNAMNHSKRTGWY